jgi:hypothetical protein
MPSRIVKKFVPVAAPIQKIITLRMLMINQAQKVFGRFPASLIYVLIVTPSPAVRPTLVPLPCRRTSADLPVALDTALLLCTFLLLAAKETRSGCLGLVIELLAVMHEILLQCSPHRRFSK